VKGYVTVCAYLKRKNLKTSLLYIIKNIYSKMITAQFVKEHRTQFFIETEKPQFTITFVTEPPWN